MDHHVVVMTGFLTVWLFILFFLRMNTHTKLLLFLNIIHACLGPVVTDFFTILAGLWSICWSVALAGVLNQTYECDANNVCSNPSYGLLFLLFLSYFFTHQVLQVRCVCFVVVY